MDAFHIFLRLIPFMQPVLVLHVGYMALDVLYPVERHPRGYRVALAVLFSVSLVYALSSAVEFTPGVRIDVRFGVIGAAVIFAGPLVATLCAIVGVLFRPLLGGMAQVTGQVGMVTGLLSFMLLRALLLKLNKMQGKPQILSTKQQLLTAFGGMMMCLVETKLLFQLHLGAEHAVPWPPGLTLALFPCEGIIVFMLFGFLQLQQRFSQAHRRLIASEAELNAMVSAMPDTLLTFDDRGCILEIRKRTSTEMYPNLHSLVGRSLAEVVPPAIVSEFMEMVDKTMTLDVMTERQFSVVTKSGKTCHAEVRIVRIGAQRGLAVLRDLTEKVQQEEQLSGTRAKLELLAENMEDMMGLLEPDGRLSYVTPSYRGLIGSDTPLEVNDWRDALSEPDLTRALQTVEAIRNGVQNSAQLEFRMHRPDTDAVIWLQVRYTPVIRDGARTQQVLFHVRNISAVRDLQRRARLAELAVQHISDAVLVTRVADDTIIYCNRGFTDISGYAEHEALTHEVDLLLNSFPVQGVERKTETLAATGAWSGEVLSQRKDGSWFPEWRHVSLFENPVDGAQYYVKILRDLSQERSQQETVYSLKHRDALTGLPNRGYFLSAINVQIERYSQKSIPFAVASLTLLDVDRVTKAYGRSVFDRLLKLVAMRLRGKLGDAVPLARVESHTFALLVERDISAALLTRNLRAVLSQFDQPYLVDGREISLEASIGAARFPEDGDSAESLMHKSQLALEAPAARAGGQVVFFQRESAETGLRRLSLEAALRETLLSDASELYLEYQPRISLTDEEVLGFEALLRWYHDELGQISPSEFIPMAEECGLIHFLGNWVFEAVCKQLSAWRDAGLVLKPVAVNLSVRQMYDEKLPQRLVEATRKYGIDPELIELEVTESEVMNDLAFTSGVLRTLRDLGFSIALDDFGTGYSSMAYLQRLPLDVLKLDHSFVRDLGRNNESEDVVRSLVAMAHSLELQTVAEGVETEEQRKFLLEVGCQAMQGFLFSPPVSPADIRGWLASRPATLLGVRPSGSMRLQ